MTPPGEPAGITAEVLRLWAVFFLVAALVAVFLRRERRHAVRVVGLLGAAVLLRLAAGAVVATGMPAAAKAVGFVALVLEGMAWIELAAILLFSVLLGALRVATPRILRDLSVALSYVGLLLWIFSRHQVDVSGIVATSAVVTAVVGFSLQDVLVNVMAGIAVELDGSIRPGDWVRLGDQTGKVRELGWRQTTLETRNGDTLVVPNVHFMKNPVFLQGRRSDEPKRERRWLAFGVDYRTSPERVLAVVGESLLRAPIPHVAAEPAPQVLLMGFEESWSRYAVRYWLTDLLADDVTDSVVRERVYFALRREGIPLSIPAQEVFLQPEDSEYRERQREKDAAARLRAVESVSIFRSLTADERARVAEGLVRVPFAAGEAIVVQGRAVHHLYVLTSGSVEVRVAVEGAPQKAIATIEAPDFFGEMGMLTGEARRATVVATTEAECWRLAKERFHEVIAARPQIAEEVSRVLAERDVNLAAAREGLSEEARRRRFAEQHRSLTDRIREFFGVE